MRILVEASDPDARAGLLETLARHPAVIVGGETAWDRSEDGAAPDVAAPQVVVWDLGAGTARPDFVAARYPIVALVTDEGDAIEARAAGVQAVLPRDADADLIAMAAVAVAHGLVVFDPAYAPGGHSAPPVEGPAAVEDLTPRESEILQWLAEGLSNKAIAQRLGISEHTVKFHLNAILGKLGAHTRTEAVTRAARLGWIVL